MILLEIKTHEPLLRESAYTLELTRTFDKNLLWLHSNGYCHRSLNVNDKPLTDLTQTELASQNLLCLLRWLKKGTSFFTDSLLLWLLLLSATVVLAKFYFPLSESLSSVNRLSGKEKASTDWLVGWHCPQLRTAASANLYGGRLSQYCERIVEGGGVIVVRRQRQRAEPRTTWLSLRFSMCLPVFVLV